MQEDRQGLARTHEEVDAGSAVHGGLERHADELPGNQRPISRELVACIETVLGSTAQEVAVAIAAYLHEDRRLPITLETWTTTQQMIIGLMRSHFNVQRLKGVEELAVDARIQMQA